MRSFGSAALLAVGLIVAMLSPGVAAEVTAVVDRTQMALGDSFRLILTATEGEDLDAVDLSVLASDFDILQRSSTSQTRIVNGRRSNTRQLQIDIAPRTEGNLQIPGLRIANSFTDPIAITVSPEPDLASGDQPLLFEAEIDRSQVYVQGQLILTLRVMQAINLEGSQISSLELENAFFKELEQKQFRRNVDGRPWLVHEVRYAIFPEQSGTLNIPAQVFTAREAVGRRSFFDISGGGRRLRRTTEPLQIEVLPRPRQFPSNAWLPARNLTLEEEWSTPPEQLRAGESATRTLRLTGEGLQGAQLPPIRFKPIDGVKYYPDQPRISETETPVGLRGTRQDSAALVPTREGKLVLPQIRIPWWDTESETTRYAVLPERTLDIAAGDIPPAPAPSAPVAEVSTNPDSVVIAPAQSALPWKIGALISTLGWLLTLGYLLWQRLGNRDLTGAESRTSSKGSSEKQHFKDLLTACEQNNPTAARSALIQWVNAASGNENITSLDQVCARFDDAQLDNEVAALEQALYGDKGAASAWRGDGLLTAAKVLQESQSKKVISGDMKLALYPSGS